MNRYELPPASVLRALFSYEDGKLYWLNDARRGKTKAGNRAGSVDADGYRSAGVYGVYYKEHRIIWRMHHPRGKMPTILDHIDGDRSNNKIENLRVATHAVNMLNRRSQKKPKPRKGNKLSAILGERHDRRNTSYTN